MQDGLPLAISSISPTSPAFADLDPFPPPAVPRGAPPPSGAAALPLPIQFEGTGKWPNHADAVRNLKAAFYLRLASVREAQSGVLCEVNRAYAHIHTCRNMPHGLRAPVASFCTHTLHTPCSGDDSKSIVHH